MAEIETFVCENPGCQVAQTGKCLEGLPVEQCPHRVSKKTSQPSVANEREAPISAEPTSTSHEVLALPKGGLLNINEAISLMRAMECHVVALVGPNDAGKTTLITSLYEMYHKKPFGGFHFFGSRTLYGLEEVCHLGRAASHRAIPHTERTSRAEGLRFFHLGLRGEVDERVINFLFSERAGEAYGSIADDPAIVSEYPEIGRADCISIIVDGKRLADIGARHNVISDSEMILQGLLDGDALRPEQRLAIVLSKYDEILNLNVKDRADADFATLVGNIKSLFSKHFCEVEAFITAARPTIGSVAHGLGIADLLKFWARPRTIQLYRIKVALSSRAFSRLKALDLQ